MARDLLDRLVLATFWSTGGPIQTLLEQEKGRNSKAEN